MSQQKQYLPGPDQKNRIAGEILGILGERITMTGLLRLLALQEQELPSRILKEMVDIDPNSNAGRNMQGLLSEGQRRGFVDATRINARLYMWYVTEKGLEQLKLHRRILKKQGWWFDEEDELSPVEDGDTPEPGSEGVYVETQSAGA